MAKKKTRAGNSQDKLNAQIQRGEFAPLYLLHGSENVSKEESLRALVDAAVEPASKAFNLDIFRGEEMDAADAVSRATAFPMMASRRVVVVKRLERLRDPDLRTFLPLVDNPVETTVLVFTADKLDGRKKISAALRKNAVSVEFKPPYESELPRWIRNRAAAPEKTHRSRRCAQCFTWAWGRIRGNWSANSRSWPSIRKDEKPSRATT